MVYNTLVDHSFLFMVAVLRYIRILNWDDLLIFKTNECILNIYDNSDILVILYLIRRCLHEIVYSTNSVPFCLDNVKRFKRIGCYMFLMAVIDGIVNWKKESKFEFIAIQSGSLKGSFIMYIILSCIALVLSEIFKQAVELKSEKDITV